MVSLIGKLFGPKRPENPLDQLTTDELNVARVKLERSRDTTLTQITKLEQQKELLITQGSNADTRTRRDLARRVLESEEQIKQLDQQLAFYSKQGQAISRFIFLKQNQQQVVDLGIDKVLGQMDTGDLRQYVEDIVVQGAVSGSRLDELNEMLGEALGSTMTDEDNPDLDRVLAQMELASKGDSDDTWAAFDSADGESPANKADGSDHESPAAAD